MLLDEVSWWRHIASSMAHAFNVAEDFVGTLRVRSLQAREWHWIDSNGKNGN